MLYAVYATDKPGSQAIRMANRPAHLAYAKEWIQHVVMGGPLLADDNQTMIGSLVIFDLPDRASVERYLAGDPYVKAGLFESVVVRAYKKIDL
ncbi:MAG: YciI family protein [Rhodospirillales bacterium]|nr:YciI family protein [Rhodospirillales bacterium]